MKQGKKNLFLGGILLVLLFMVYASRNNSTSKSNNFLASINASGVDKIVITAENASTTLEKDEEKWKIGGTKSFYVSKAVSEDLNSKIAKIPTAVFELISTNGERKDVFKTNEELGVIVAVYNGDNMNEFIIGRIGPDFTSTYVSKIGLDDTFLIKDLNIASLFSRKEWRDLAILNNDKEKINKVRFQYPDREFTVEKKIIKVEGEEDAEEWRGVAPYDFSINEEKIDDILNVMSSLYTMEIPAQTFEGTGLEKHLIIVQATGDGVDSTLMIGNGDGREGEEYFYAKSGASDNIYLITKEQRDTLDQTIKKME